MVMALGLLSACVADRDYGVRSSEKIAVPYDSGAIFKSGFNERPLYEARRARNVGDLVIMNVANSAISSKKDATKTKNISPADAEGTDAERRRARSEDGESELLDISPDALVGPVSMTVIDVMENGNLLVTGGRQVIVDQEEKYLRVTGVVDPNHMVNGYTVDSTKMSQVHIQIDDVHVRGDRSSSNINEGNSVFGGFFNSVNPR